MRKESIKLVPTEGAGGGMLHRPELQAAAAPLENLEGIHSIDYCALRTLHCCTVVHCCLEQDSVKSSVNCTIYLCSSWRVNLLGEFYKGAFMRPAFSA